MIGQENTMQEVLEMMTGAGAFRPNKIVIPGSRFSFVKSDDEGQAGETETEKPAEAPAVTLTAQTVEIALTSCESSCEFSETPRVPVKKVWTPPVYDVDPEEEKRVVAMRTEQLLGKTVTGSYFTTGNNRIKHWIRWNNKKCDNVYVHKDLVDKILGPEPKLGTRLRTKITELGPDTATAWRMHPQCTSIELVPQTSYFSNRSSGTLAGRRLISLCSSRTSSPTDSWSPSARTTRPRFVNTRADQSSSWRNKSPSPRQPESLEG